MTRAKARIVAAGLACTLSSCAGSDRYSAKGKLELTSASGERHSVKFVSPGMVYTDGYRECYSPGSSKPSHWVVRKGEGRFTICFFHKERQKFVEYGPFEAADCYSGNLARVRQGGRYGFVDMDGGYAVEPRYKATSDSFVAGLAAVKDFEGKWGFIEPDGKVVIPPRFYAAILTGKAPNRALVSLDPVGAMKAPRDPGSLRPQYLDDEIKLGRWVIVNASGQVLGDAKVDAIVGSSSSSVPPDERVPWFTRGIMPARQQGGRWGYIDDTGRFVIPPRFDHAGPFGLTLSGDEVVDLPARVMLDGRWGSLDRAGEVGWDEAPP